MDDLRHIRYTATASLPSHVHRQDSCTPQPADTRQKRFPQAPSCKRLQYVSQARSSCTKSRAHEVGWKERTLEPTDEESEGVDVWEILYAGLGEGERAPGDLHGCEPVGGPDILYNDVARAKKSVGLHGHCRNGEKACICITA